MVYDLCVLRPFGHKNPSDFISSGPVATILGQAFDGGIHHLDTRFATDRLQCLHAKDGLGVKLIKIPAIVGAEIRLSEIVDVPNWFVSFYFSKSVLG